MAAPFPGPAAGLEGEMSASKNKQHREDGLNADRLEIWHACIVDGHANGSLRLLDVIAPYEYKLDGSCWFCAQYELLDCSITQVGGVGFYRYPWRSEHRDWRWQE